MAAKNVLIAASGTGGHLFPALFIAKALKAFDPEVCIEFVGSGRALEEQIIDKAGFKRHVIQTVGLKRRGIKGLLEFLFTFPKALLQTRALFSSFAPDVVIGVGGYVSFFPVIMAWLKGVPSWIHEAELEPGMANKILAHFADRISYSFKDARVAGNSKAIFTGHPVREEIKQIAIKEPLALKPRNILVLGGSQGADAIDKAMLELAPKLAAADLSVWHQSRPENIEALTRAYTAAKLESQVMPFVHDMPGAYQWAHLLICRAGASTIMELSVLNKPAILIPYPFAQGDHQTANAMTLVKEGKALLVDERQARDPARSDQSFAERLWQALQQLLEPQAYSKMQARSFSGRKTDAAEEIARAALELAGKSSASMLKL